MLRQATAGYGVLYFAYTNAVQWYITRLLSMSCDRMVSFHESVYCFLGVSSFELGSVDCLLGRLLHCYVGAQAH